MHRCWSLRLATRYAGDVHGDVQVHVAGADTAFAVQVCAVLSSLPHATCAGTSERPLLLPAVSCALYRTLMMITTTLDCDCRPDCAARVATHVRWAVSRRTFGVSDWWPWSAPRVSTRTVKRRRTLRCVVVVVIVVVRVMCPPPRMLLLRSRAAADVRNHCGVSGAGAASWCALLRCCGSC